MNKTIQTLLQSAGLTLIITGLTTTPLGGDRGKLVVLGTGTLFLAAGLWQVIFPMDVASRLSRYVSEANTLLERCGKEDPNEVNGAINSWTTEVTNFLSKSNYPQFAALFMNHSDITLYASQHDNKATLLLRGCRTRLTQFLTQLRND